MHPYFKDIACSALIALGAIAPLPSPAAAVSSPLFHCVARTKEATPPAVTPRVVNNTSHAPQTLPVPPAPCPAGQVPQPTSLPNLPGRALPRGIMPLSSVAGGERYFYATASSGLGAGCGCSTPIGVDASLYVANPHVAVQSTPGDYHSLTEMAATNNSQTGLIGTGWVVDPPFFGGSTQTHLFVEREVAGVYAGLNDSAWHQVSSTQYPGMVIATGGTPLFAELYSGGNWWVYYNGEWIGYYPGSLWSAFSFAGYGFWYGEVANPQSITVPQSDMGNGLLASSVYSAHIDSTSYYNGSNGVWYASAASPSASDPSYYTIRRDSSVSNKFYYGGQAFSVTG